MAEFVFPDSFTQLRESFEDYIDAARRELQLFAVPGRTLAECVRDMRESLGAAEAERDRLRRVLEAAGKGGV